MTGCGQGLTLLLLGKITVRQVDGLTRWVLLLKKFFL